MLCDLLPPLFAYLQLHPLEFFFCIPFSPADVGYGGEWGSKLWSCRSHGASDDNRHAVARHATCHLAQFKSRIDHRRPSRNGALHTEADPPCTPFRYMPWLPNTLSSQGKAHLSDCTTSTTSTPDCIRRLDSAAMRGAADPQRRACDTTGNRRQLHPLCAPSGGK